MTYAELTHMLQSMETGPITPKQKKVLDYIRTFTDGSGYCPSQREIADRFGFKSLGTVQNYLVRLERNGFLKRRWNAKRALEMVEVESAGAELPLVGAVAAGRPIEAIETPDVVEVPQSMLGRGENFVLNVEGDSMIGEGILNGDLIVVTKRAEAQNGQTVVAIVDGEATVKIFYRAGDKVELRPANPEYETLVVDGGHDFRIEGIVVGVIRHC